MTRAEEADASCWRGSAKSRPNRPRSGLLHHCLGRDLHSMSEYFQKWRGKVAYREMKTVNPVAYDEVNGLIVIITSRFIHAYKKPKAEFLSRSSIGVT
ncbi:hypothetical protein ACIRPQ_10555 [Streptomyces sp. NPDC101213]|uniref:hypothetical protein n=1 Tax=Streptomyces sp. NPDC101213 TaxID=3366130 RepID=UPI0037FC906F